MWLQLLCSRAGCEGDGGSAAGATARGYMPCKQPHKPCQRLLTVYIKLIKETAYSCLRLKLQPSVSRHLPPLGWHRLWEQPAHTTTVVACEKTVVIA